MTIEEDFERFKRERPAYEALVARMQQTAERACRKAGLRCTVSGRAKTLDSFAKKLITKPQPYGEVYDKAGVRIVTTYPDERDAAATLVRSLFNVTWFKDFAEENAPNVFEYRGQHFTVGLREDDRGGVPKEAWPLAAELQIHRPGEAVWASVGHDLLYQSKSRLVVEPHARRAMNRLSALLELVDISMGEIRQQLLHGPGADEARIIDAVEKDFLRLRGAPFREPLTVKIVWALRPLLGDVEQFLRTYQTFIETNDAKLTHVFNEYKADFRHLLLGQPESLLIFFLMEHDRPGLEERWPSQVPEKALDGLDGVWVPSEP